MRRQTKRKEYIEKKKREYALCSTQATKLDLPTYEPACQKIGMWHNSDATIRFLFGGNRAGKTEALCYEIVRHARSHPTTYWAIALSYEFCRILWEKIVKYTDPSEIEKVSWMNSSRGIPGLAKFSNGARIFFKSCEQGRKLFQAESVRGIFFDEEPPEIIYKESLMRTVDQGGFVCCSMTPLNGRNWVYKQIYKSASPDIYHDTVSLLENQYIPFQNKEIVRQMYSADEIQARFYGNFTVLSGAVFKEFSESTHIIKRFPIPQYYRRVKAIDFGHSVAFATLWVAVSPEGKMYAYAEHKQGETLLADHVKRIREIENDMSLYEPVGTYDFYATEAALADWDSQQIHELQNLGLWTEEAEKGVEISIQILNRLMKEGRFFVFEDLMELIDEISSYRYKEIKEGHDEKEVILKINDHLVDCLRYCANYFFLAGFQAVPPMASGAGDSLVKGY